ncbi:MAG: hypothetical protein FWG35_04215 [Spirochaetaceae bacterium]|nr:hypothetical protein [Spirochaetaceae bacterium]
MSDFLASHAPPLWYEETGPDHDVVISSKVKISRNLSSFAYPHLLSEQALAQTGSRIERALRESGAGAEPSGDASFPDFVRYDFASLSETASALLAEEGRARRGDEFRRASLFVSRDRNICVEVNAKDHLCISSLRGGSNLRQAWRDVDALDSVLELRLDYAVCLDLGYLSSEIDYSGTAMEASLVLHLPGVSLSGRLEKVEKILSGASFTMESFLPVKGPGAEFFLISGRPRPGESEENLLQKFESITDSLLTYEREMRNILFEKRGEFLEDQMCRAFGILERAKLLSYEEAIKLLSLLRMGYGRSVPARWDKVTQMIFRCLPAHIRMRLGTAAEPPEDAESRERASFIHEELAKTGLG